MEQLDILKACGIDLFGHARAELKQPDSYSQTDTYIYCYVCTRVLDLFVYTTTLFRVFVILWLKLFTTA